MPFTSRNLPSLLACTAAFALLATLLVVASEPVGAESATTLGTAADSPIATPFTGTYEVWCTDRNPAPGARCSRHHGSPAIDIGMDIGTPIRATGSGVVIETETGCGFGYCRGGAGNFISIGHADGTFSRYLHLDQVQVEAGDAITVGQQIGTSGVTGQSSSAHLHYDEHFPAGNRIPMGPWIGCVDGAAVQYPDVFGVSDWNDVPYGSLIVNDDYECLDGVDPNQVEQPVVLSGDERFGVIAPSTSPNTHFQISVHVQANDRPFVRQLRGTALALFDRPDGPVAIRIRELHNEEWLEWSDPVVYDPNDHPEAPTCGGLHATMDAGTGTPTADVVIGSDDADEIDGRGGDDLICGNGGDDTILAGPGRDQVWGGAGNDIIRGGRGADTIWGEAGDDTVRGGDGPDQLFGGTGNDQLLGTAGNDRVNGGSGTDHLIGGIGHDHLRGGSDDDEIEGRNGRDFLGGGNGDDHLAGGNGRDRLVGAAGSDIFHGGSGDDRCAPDPTTLQEQFEGCER